MRFVVGLLGALALASPAYAVGEIELNHTCATTTGCLTGDGAGYPITATAAGSYRLTSNLTVPAGAIGIQFQDNASLDLGGFEVAGPVSCGLGTCPAVTSGIGVFGGSRVTVTNGRVRGFGANCIEVGRGARVERVQVNDCAQHGIVASGGSFVAGNQLDLIGQKGIAFLVPIFPPGSAGIYRDNTIGVTGGLSVENGRASGPNTCFDQKCGTAGKKLVYLTATEHTGATARSACDAGFHMASLNEIFDLTAFEWDDSRGITPLADQGQGVPSFDGWVRTGSNADGSLTSIPGNANCQAYTTTTNRNGTLASPYSNLEDTSTMASPWLVVALPCASTENVWCAQD